MCTVSGKCLGVIEQNVLIRFDDADTVVLEMFLQPISIHQRFRMRVFSWGETEEKMGLTGLEPVTLRLSSACSNQLSYRPGSRLRREIFECSIFDFVWRASRAFT